MWFYQLTGRIARRETRRAPYGDRQMVDATANAHPRGGEEPRPPSAAGLRRPRPGRVPGPRESRAGAGSPSAHTAGPRPPPVGRWPGPRRYAVAPVRRRPTACRRLLCGLGTAVPALCRYGLLLLCGGCPPVLPPVSPLAGRLRGAGRLGLGVRHRDVTPSISCSAVVPGGVYRAGVTSFRAFHPLVTPFRWAVEPVGVGPVSVPRPPGPRTVPYCLRKLFCPPGNPAVRRVALRDRDVVET